MPGHLMKQREDEDRMPVPTVPTTVTPARPIIPIVSGTYSGTISAWVAEQPLVRAPDGANTRAGAGVASNPTR